MDSHLGMVQLRLGRAVREARGYAIVEVLGPDAARNEVTGFALVGPEASSSIIYANPLEAMEALHDIEQRGASAL